MLRSKDRLRYVADAAHLARPTIFLLAAAALYAQTQQFGGYTFSPPAGYSQETVKSQLALVKIDQQRRTFCQLALQPTQNGLESGEKELDAEWQLLVTSVYKVTSAPASTSVPGSGAVSQVLARVAATSTASNPKMVSTVLVARFPKYYVSMLVNASGADIMPTCTNDAVGILASVRLATAPPSGTNVAAPAAAPVTAPPPPQRPASSSRIPTGNTPLLFAGMPGWLPSGNGLPIPDPGFVRGVPVGMWWVANPESMGNTKANLYVFLEGGIRASNPRFGGPRLYDFEGQKQQRGVTGVGTYAVEGGQFTETYDGYRNAGAYTSGSDSTGAYFKVGERLYRALTPATAQSIVGHWRGYQSEITFRADGTWVYGPPSLGTAGTFVVDGYLIQQVPKSGPMIIDHVGMSGDMLILGRSLLSRVK